MPRRFFHRKDLNQDEMVAALEGLGLIVHKWGEESDLIVQHAGITVLCEVRQAGQPRKARKGRQAAFQKRFCVKWLQTTEDCVELAKTLRKWHRAICERAVLGEEVLG